METRERKTESYRECYLEVRGAGLAARGAARPPAHPVGSFSPDAVPSHLLHKDATDMHLLTVPLTVWDHAVQNLTHNGAIFLSPRILTLYPGSGQHFSPLQGIPPLGVVSGSPHRRTDLAKGLARCSWASAHRHVIPGPFLQVHSEVRL